MSLGWPNMRDLGCRPCVASIERQLAVAYRFERRRWGDRNWQRAAFGNHPVRSLNDFN